MSLHYLTNETISNILACANLSFVSTLEMSFASTKSSYTQKIFPLSSTLGLVPKFLHTKEILETLPRSMAGPLKLKYKGKKIFYYFLFDGSFTSSSNLKCVQIKDNLYKKKVVKKRRLRENLQWDDNTQS